MPSRNVRARPLPWQICEEPILGKLKDPWAKLLFTWLYPSTDNLGCIEGEPAFVKSQIFPRENIALKQVEKLLADLHKVGALIWYEVNGIKYIFLPKAIDWQKLVGNMVAESSFPAPSEQELQAWCSRTGNRYIPKRGRSGDPRISFIRRSNKVLTGYGLKIKSKSKVNNQDKEKGQDKVEGESEGEPAERDRADCPSSFSNLERTDRQDLNRRLSKGTEQKLLQAGIDINDIDRYTQWYRKERIPEAVIEEAVDKVIEVIEEGTDIRNPFAYLKKATQEKVETS